MSITKDIRDTFTRYDNALNQLIVLNLLVFAVAVVLYAIAYLSQLQPWYETLMRQLQLSANAGVLLRHPWTLLTYAFLHLNPFHILFNMLNLYWFGQLIREYLGSRRLVSLYVLGGLAGGVVFVLAYNLIPVLKPEAAVGLPILGASAAVVAIVVAAATKLPDYTFMLFILGPVKIKWIALAVVLISIAGINNGNTGGEISHLGGALLGYIFIKQLDAGRDLGQPVIATGQWLGRLFDRQPMKVTHRGTAASAKPTQKAGSRGAAPEDEVNSILDKISRSGYESLSKEEKQKLFQASQQ